MTPKEKAVELVNKFSLVNSEMIIVDGLWDRDFKLDDDDAKQCALIAVENEYNSLREMLFNLRSCCVIESERVYLHRLQQLIDEETQVKQEIEKL